MKRFQHREIRQAGFNLEPGSEVAVEADCCRAHVRQGGGRELEIECVFEASAGSAAEAREAATRGKLETRVSGRRCAIHIEAAAGKVLRRGWRWWRDVDVEARLELRLPATCRLSIATRVGDVEVETLDGSLWARTGAGNVLVGAAAAVDLEVGAGSVGIRACLGALRARVESGEVIVERVGGGLDLVTGSGSVRLGLAESLREPGRITTGAGSVWLEIPETLAFDFSAETQAGEILLPFPIAVESRGAGRRASGRVRGGGAKIAVTTVAGDIVCRPPGGFPRVRFSSPVAPSAG